ncbi:peptidyl-prolyl cis-trans isomerase D [Devosia enhydra]|uniref:Peptidyl-prolyl cis-trans isomerase D n=1 Tax=Devosia enhydra TaxID=665118 RepID=A0A1K2HUH2_9HYPH|nr:peptidylprolyl isomerase [Devosia enhydra]SFZ82165.1 peptidyl-prolyl cis-trans isomerase D [Devosia enhydra]
MLDSLRNLGRTFIGKVLVALLILGTASFGISNVIFDLGGNTVARVGDADISAREFQRSYNAQLNQYAQQTGRVPTPAEAESLGIPSVVLMRLGADTALARLGQTYGLGVSDSRLGQMVRQDPSFAGAVGQFDRASFVRVLQQSGFTEAEYFELQAQAARRQQLSAAFLADYSLPETAMQLVGRYAGDTRTIDYFVLGDESLLPPAEPTEEELAAYLTENQSRFRTVETRTAQIMILSPQSLADGIDITEEAIAAEFERTRDQRAASERRTIQQVVLNTDALRSAFEEGLAAGRSFDDLVDETGASVIELGTLARSEVADPNLAREAFALDPSTFAIIPGIGGRRAINVTAIESGSTATLDETRDPIRQSLALAEARRQQTQVLDQIEEFRAALRPLPEIAERFGLTVETVDVSATGAGLEGIEELPAGGSQLVATALFAAVEGRLAPGVALGSNAHAWFDLEAIEPARDQTLDEVRDAVVAAITAERTAAALAEQVDTVVARLDGGEDFANVAISLNQFPELSPPLGRNGDGSAVLTTEVAEAVFSGGIGHSGAARNANGDYVIFKVVDVVPAPEGSAERVRDFLQTSARNALYAEFVSGLRDTAGLRINQQALTNLLATATGN